MPMVPPTRLEFPLAKAEYLLTRVADPGRGGDKRNFWHTLMGFKSAEALRAAMLETIVPESLELVGSDDIGDRYQAVIQLTGADGKAKLVLTVWIMLKGTEVARFVTAYPSRRRRPL